MTPQNHARRKLLKTIAAGSGVISLNTIPDRWARPVVNSVLLPTHAQLTGCYEYFGINLNQTIFQTRSEPHWYAGVMETVLPNAQAQEGDEVDFCVTVCGSTATVVFRNNQNNAEFMSSPNINGSSASVSAVSDPCSVKGGPVSARVVNYTPGAMAITIEVTGSGGGVAAGWRVTVPQGSCQPFGPFGLCPGE